VAYCTGCGNELNDNKFCSNCGRANGEAIQNAAIPTSQPAITKFCVGCGRGLVVSAVVCLAGPP
jgi:uncharacterized membrane protein YvbJ